MQRLPEGLVRREAAVLKGLIEAGNRSPIHLLMRSVAAMEPHDGGLVAKRARIERRSPKRLGPIRGQPSGVVGMEAVAEGVAHDFVGEDASVPRIGQTEEAILAARGFVHGTHPNRMPPPGPDRKVAG